MKKPVFLFLLLFGCKMAFSQSDTAQIYLRFPTVPPFKITSMPDSTLFTKDDLKKKKATLIMIFNPDCEHCQHETRELIAHIDRFKKIQIVMATPMEFSYVRKFYNDYNIAEYPNIVMGRDPAYFFGTFYHIRSFPALFLYDKKGNFVKFFNGSVPVESIPDAL